MCEMKWRKSAKPTFTQLQRQTIPKCNDYSVGTPTLHSELCIKIHFLTLCSVGVTTLYAIKLQRRSTAAVMIKATFSVNILGYKDAAQLQRNGISPTLLCLLTQPVGMASKSTTAAKYVYAPLVMVSLGAW